MCKTQNLGMERKKEEHRSANTTYRTCMCTMRTTEGTKDEYDDDYDDCDDLKGHKRPEGLGHGRGERRKISAAKSST